MNRQISSLLPRNGKSRRNWRVLWNTSEKNMAAALLSLALRSRKKRRTLFHDKI